MNDFERFDQQAHQHALHGNALKIYNAIQTRKGGHNIDTADYFFSEAIKIPQVAKSPLSTILQNKSYSYEHRLRVLEQILLEYDPRVINYWLTRNTDEQDLACILVDTEPNASAKQLNTFLQYKSLPDKVVEYAFNMQYEYGLMVAESALKINLLDQDADNTATEMLRILKQIDSCLAEQTEFPHDTYTNLEKYHLDIVNYADFERTNHQTVFTYTMLVEANDLGGPKQAHDFITHLQHLTGHANTLALTLLYPYLQTGVYARKSLPTFSAQTTAYAPKHTKPDINIRALADAIQNFPPDPRGFTLPVEQTIVEYYKWCYPKIVRYPKATDIILHIPAQTMYPDMPREEALLKYARFIGHALSAGIPIDQINDVMDFPGSEWQHDFYYSAVAANELSPQDKATIKNILRHTQYIPMNQETFAKDTPYILSMFKNHAYDAPDLGYYLKITHIFKELAVYTNTPEPEIAGKIAYTLDNPDNRILQSEQSKDYTDLIATFEESLPALHTMDVSYQKFVAMFMQEFLAHISEHSFMYCRRLNTLWQQYSLDKGMIICAVMDNIIAGEPRTKEAEAQFDRLLKPLHTKFGEPAPSNPVTKLLYNSAVAKADGLINNAITALEEKTHCGLMSLTPDQQQIYNDVNQLLLPDAIEAVAEKLEGEECEQLLQQLGQTYRVGEELAAPIVRIPDPILNEAVSDLQHYLSDAHNEQLIRGKLTELLLDSDSPDALTVLQQYFDAITTQISNIKRIKAENVGELDID